MFYPDFSENFRMMDKFLDNAHKRSVWIVGSIPTKEQMEKEEEIERLKSRVTELEKKVKP